MSACKIITNDRIRTHVDVGGTLINILPIPTIDWPRAFVNHLHNLAQVPRKNPLPDCV